MSLKSHTNILNICETLSVEFDLFFHRYILITILKYASNE